VRVLVCGQRDFVDQQGLFEVLDFVHALTPISLIIEGEARGADTFAREWAISRGVEFKPFPADWDRYHRAAGPIRNRQMLVEGLPDMGLAFYHDPSASKGTKNMVKQLKQAEVIVCEIVLDRPLGLHSTQEPSGL